MTGPVRPGEAEAVEKAALALWPQGRSLLGWDGAVMRAELAVAAAYPLIEAAVRADERERVAQRIEGLRVNSDDVTIGPTGRTLRRIENFHYDTAARLVREAGQ